MRGKFCVVEGVESVECVLGKQRVVDVGLWGEV